ncbi:hypothetical protein [Methylosinus sp. RM1]|uniref:hypothetical protein n=1 Tax=Methylosinus sp. RM1 TaxID=2583817 RepID=UPI00140C057E|nr:hypothetical protein [Methylosinus sp. RM1]
MRAVRDVKDIVGLLMRIVDGGETSVEEVEALCFDAEGALGAALNGAYILLLEFAFDREARQRDAALDARMRLRLGESLAEAARIAETAGAR